MKPDTACTPPPPPAADHLELVFLATTLTAAVGAGWTFTATPVPQRHPARFGAAPPAVRLALRSR